MKAALRSSPPRGYWSGSSCAGGAPPTSGGIFLVIAVAALGVYGSGLVHFPNVEHVIRDLGNALGKWTYLLVA